MLEAWASLKSFQRTDREDDAPPFADDPGNPTADVHGESRRNDTLASKTDPDPRLVRKGKGREAKLSYVWYGVTYWVGTNVGGHHLAHSTPSAASCQYTAYPV